MKTVTVDVPVKVRKNDDGTYQYRWSDGAWSAARTEDEWLGYTGIGARAICKAIDSGAFVDPLPTAVGAVVLISGVTFVLAQFSISVTWHSSIPINGTWWHTPEQVQSYGEFHVKYDPDKEAS